MKAPKETPKPKSKAPLIPPEVFEKLSRDKYCFNMEHEREIERLVAELGKSDSQIRRLNEKNSSVDKEIAQKVAQEAEAFRKREKEAEDRADDLRKQLEESKKDLEAMRSLVEELRDQIASQEVSLQKKYRDESRCFDILHRMIRGRMPNILSVPELFIFSISLLAKPPGTVEEITVSVSPDLLPLIEKARKIVDTQQARKLGEEIRKNPLMGSFHLGDPT